MKRPNLIIDISNHNKDDDHHGHDNQCQNTMKMIPPIGHNNQYTLTGMTRAEMQHCVFQSNVFDDMLFPVVEGQALSHRHLDYWLDRWNPLKINPFTYKWLYVHRKNSPNMESLQFIFKDDDINWDNDTPLQKGVLSPSEKQALVDKARALCQPFKRRSKSSGEKPVRTTKAQKEDAIKSLERIAKLYGCTSGKWILRVPRNVLEYVWNIIAKATFDGRLGPSAKISTLLPTNQVCSAPPRPKKLRVMMPSVKQPSGIQHGKSSKSLQGSPTLSPTPSILSTSSASPTSSPASPTSSPASSTSSTASLPPSTPSTTSRSSKAFNTYSDNMAVLCVYCEDGFNAHNAERLLDSIKSLPLPSCVGVKTGFKPDFYTIVGLYTNTHTLPCVIHRNLLL